MFERFDGCHMLHVVGPQDSVVQSSVTAYGLLTYLLTYKQGSNIPVDQILLEPGKRSV